MESCIIYFLYSKFYKITDQVYLPGSMVGKACTGIGVAYKIVYLENRGKVN